MTTYTRRRPARSALRTPKTYRILGILGIIIIIQLLYPAHRPTPFTRLDGVGVSGKSEAAIQALVATKTYQEAPLEISVQGPAKNITHKGTVEATGLKPDVSATTTELYSYPVWQRFVPLSLLVRGLATDHAVTVNSVGKEFDAFIDTLTATCAVSATDATVVVKNGTASLAVARPGQLCKKSVVQQRLLDMRLLKSGTRVVLDAETVKPKRSDKQVKSTVKAAQKRIDQTISLKLVGQEYTLDSATLGSFMAFTADAKDPQKLIIGINSETVREYLATLEPKIYRAPTATSKGQALNYSATNAALRKQILETGGGVAEGTVVSIAAGTKASKLYSANPAGLQELLNALVATKGQYGISVRMLDGTVTSSRGDVYYHPASTYKLYVAYALLKRIASDTYNWTDVSAGGLTISQCFDKMIVNSDNTCAEWFGNRIGWSNINSDVHAIGLTNTRTLYGQQQSTANDETLLLVKLQNGDLLPTAERDRLLGVMKRQVYRSGIPAGLKGVTVADKVGFLNADLHDSAIVYAPKQTYALTILTTGSSWASIADTAAQIQLQLDRM